MSSPHNEYVALRVLRLTFTEARWIRDAAAQDAGGRQVDVSSPEAVHFCVAGWAARHGLFASLSRVGPMIEANNDSYNALIAFLVRRKAVVAESLSPVELIRAELHARITAARIEAAEALNRAGLPETGPRSAYPDPATGRPAPGAPDWSGWEDRIEDALTEVFTSPLAAEAREAPATHAQEF